MKAFYDLWEIHNYHKKDISELGGCKKLSQYQDMDKDICFPMQDHLYKTYFSSTIFVISLHNKTYINVSIHIYCYLYILKIEDITTSQEKTS